MIDLIIHLNHVIAACIVDAKIREYVQHIADRRLERIGLEIKYCSGNPFPWMSETMDLTTESNFFERTVTEYQTSGSLSW